MALKNYRGILTVLASLMLMLALASNASATLLLAGGTVPPSPTPSPAGANLLASTGPVAFLSIPTGKIAGTLTSSVYNLDPSNPFGPLSLTFTFLISNNPGSTSSIDRFVANNFTGFATDAAFDPGIGGPVAPDTADRSVAGDTVGFNFPVSAAVIAPGQSSYLLVVFTDATQWQLTTDALIDSEVALVASLGPAVPEPASLGLLAVAGMAILRRRR